MIIELAVRKDFIATYDTARNVMIFFVRPKNLTLEIAIEDFMVVVSVLMSILFKRYEVTNNETQSTPECDRLDGANNL